MPAFTRLPDVRARVPSIPIHMDGDSKYTQLRTHRHIVNKTSHTTVTHTQTQPQMIKSQLTAAGVADKLRHFGADQSYNTDIESLCHCKFIQ